MQRNFALRMFLLIAAGLATLATAGRPAAATPPPNGDKVQDVTGMWSGLFQSTMDPRIMGTVQLDVDAMDQRHRRFMGMVTMKAGMAFTFPFDGTIAAGGELNGVGKGDAGMVEFHGMAGFVPGGAGFVDVHYKFRFPDGTMDEGFAIVLRNFIPPDPCVSPEVTGMWAGTFTSAATGATGGILADYMMLGGVGR